MSLALSSLWMTLPLSGIWVSGFFIPFLGLISHSVFPTWCSVAASQLPVRQLYFLRIEKQIIQNCKEKTTDYKET